MASLHVRAFHRAYAEFLSPEALEQITEPLLLERWREILLTKPERRVWVFDQGGMIAGHMVVDDGELRMLYVDPVAQGAGVGAALLVVAHEAGATVLHTFADNAPARAFYESRGWAFDGETEPWWGAAVVRYRRHAADGTP
jgi:GNAT superfamily N-acetyltransferase